MEPTFALAASGDIVDLEDGRMDCSSAMVEVGNGEKEKGKARWEQWCAGMDAFGGVVMLAASWLG